MNSRWKSWSVVGIGLLAAGWVNGCRCTDCTTAVVADTPRGMRVRAVGLFTNPALSTGKYMAHVNVDVLAPSTGVTSDRVTTERLEFYGAPGILTMAELHQPAHLITALPRLGQDPGIDVIEPLSWSSGWMTVPLDAAPSSFSLLVCGTFDVWFANSFDVRSECVLLTFPGIISNATMNGVVSAEDGSATPPVSATGSFYGTQHLAIYDVKVLHGPPDSTHHVASITISEGSSPTTASIIGGVTNPVYSPWIAHLNGRWDCNPINYLYVDIVYQANPGTNAPPIPNPPRYIVMFSGLTGPSANGQVVQGQTP